MYILECADGSYYTGSTNNLDLRLQQHQSGEGANHTKKRLPVKLVYAEEFDRIDEAFYREKQVQRWSRKKKEALIKGMPEELHNLAECMNTTHYKNYRKHRSEPAAFGFAQAAAKQAASHFSRWLSEVETTGWDAPLNYRKKYPSLPERSRRQRSLTAFSISPLAS